MSIATLGVISALVFLTIHYLLLPRAKEQWKATKTQEVIAKAAWVAALTAVRGIALVAAIVAASLMLMLGVLGLFGAIPVIDLQVGIQTAAWLRDRAKSVSGALSWIGLVTLVVTFIYLARRHAGRTMKAIYEDSLRREIERLQAAAQAGTWEQLPPTPAMEEVRAAAQQLHDYASNLAAQGQRDAEVQTIARKLEELQQIHMQMDWGRRIKPSFEIPPDETPKTWRARLATIVMSKGMTKTTGELGKGLSWAAMALLILTLLGVEARAVSEAADVRVVRLSQLEIKNSKQEAVETAASQTEVPAPSESDIDAVAREFERAIAVSTAIRGAQITPDAFRHARAIRRDAIKRAVIRQAVSGSGEGGGGIVQQGSKLAEHPSLERAPTLAPAERETLESFLRSTAEDGRPRTEIGRQFAAELRRDPVTRTRGFASFSGALRQRAAEFGQLRTFDEVGSSMVNEVFGRVLGEVAPDAATEAGKLAARVRDGMGKAAFKAYYDAKKDAFLADVARGVDVDQALARVAAESRDMSLLTGRQRVTLQSVLAEVPTGERLANQIENHRPRLSWDAPTPTPAARAQALQLARSAGSEQALVQIADNFATYEDFFPASESSVRNSARTTTLENFAKAAESGGLPTLNSSMGPDRARAAPGRLRANAGSSRSLVRMSTNARALRGFFRVGGVIIGEDPPAGTELPMRDLRWTRTGDSLFLELIDMKGTALPIGTFAAGTVHQALVYAADDRRVAVTMTSASAGLKIQLHPALIDTRLGLDVSSVDRFVDTYTRPQGSMSNPVRDAVGRATEHVQYAQALYRLARDYRLLELPSSTLSAETAANYQSYLSNVEGDPGARAMFARFFGRPTALIDTMLTPLAVKKDFYDQTLVRAMHDCASRSLSLAQFGRCIRAEFSTAASSAHDSWTYPEPTAETWSGVRELPFTLDRSLRFLSAPTPTAPLRFMLQVAFSSPPAFGASTDEPAVSDSTPWEFPLVARQIDAEVARRVPQDAEHRAEMRRVQDFVRLQRLFRTALNGGLGDHFYDERLVVLTGETRGDVDRVQTPRWNVAFEQRMNMLLRALLLATLGDSDSDLRTKVTAEIRSCSSLIESTSEPETIPADRWLSACGFDFVEDVSAAECRRSSEQMSMPCVALAAHNLSRQRALAREITGR